MKVGDLVKEKESARTTTRPARSGIIVERRDMGIFGPNWVVDTGGPGSSIGGGWGFIAPAENLEVISESR